jgi:hypothetical protein
MSLAQSTEGFLHHQFWVEDGDQMHWRENNEVYGGKITTQADAADFAVTARDDAAVEALADAKKVLIKPPNGIVSLEFRFRSDGSENDQNVVEMFAAAGVDHYRLIDQLTLDQGTQVFSGSIFFVDQIAQSGTEWITSPSPVSPANSIGSYVINRHAYDRFWFVASTLATTTLYIDWR